MISEAGVPTVMYLSWVNKHVMLYNHCMILVIVVKVKYMVIARIKKML